MSLFENLYPCALLSKHFDSIIMPALGKYVNPFTDFGFKRLFGEEARKGLLQILIKRN
jgi:hypothetical protein